MREKPCRKELLDYINQVSFAVDDVLLFLDTHPNNEDALNYFYEYSKKRRKALEEYATYYGPLTIDSTVESCTDRWNWIQEPWPWQEGGC